jgi:hypothetical protein
VLRPRLAVDEGGRRARRPQEACELLAATWPEQWGEPVPRVIGASRDDPGEGLLVGDDLPVLLDPLRADLGR